MLASEIVKSCTKMCLTAFTVTSAHTDVAYLTHNSALSHHFTLTPSHIHPPTHTLPPSLLLTPVCDLSGMPPSPTCRT